MPTLDAVQVTNLERRLALVEGREAAAVSQLRSAEAAAAEGESAAAENASLREQLRELKREKSQLEQHKMVSSWLVDHCALLSAGMHEACDCVCRLSRHCSTGVRRLAQLAHTLCACSLM
jgi:hypothetical protein